MSHITHLDFHPLILDPLICIRCRISGDGGKQIIGLWCVNLVHLQKNLRLWVNFGKKYMVWTNIGPHILVNNIHAINFQKLGFSR